MVIDAHLHLRDTERLRYEDAVLGGAAARFYALGAPSG